MWHYCKGFIFIITSTLSTVSSLIFPLHLDTHCVCGFTSCDFLVTLTVLTALVSLLVLIYIHFTLTDRHCSLCSRMAVPHCFPPSLENSRVSLFTLQPPPLCLQYCDSIFSVEYSIRHFKNLWIQNFWKQQFSLNAFLRRHYHLPVCLLLKLSLSHTPVCTTLPNIPS